MGRLRFIKSGFVLQLDKRKYDTNDLKYNPMQVDCIETHSTTTQYDIIQISEATQCYMTQYDTILCVIEGYC